MRLQDHESCFYILLALHATTALPTLTQFFTCAWNKISTFKELQNWSSWLWGVNTLSGATSGGNSYIALKKKKLHSYT